MNHEAMSHQEANLLLRRLRDNLARVYVGSEQTYELLLTALLARGHVLLEDVPGIGKTTLVRALAASLGLSFGRIQFTPDVMPSEITGYTIYNQHTGQFNFREGMIMKQVILADEINRASPKTQSALLEVMQEQQVTVEGHTLSLPEPFLVFATQNPVEQTGTYPLPEAQLDRFMMRIRLGYPPLEAEIQIYERNAVGQPLDHLRPVASEREVLSLQATADEVYIAPALLRYVAQLADRTRQLPSLRLGASPRAALMLVQAAKAYALGRGRDYVIPDDIQRLVEPVWAHRLLLTTETRLSGTGAADLLDELVRTLPAPQQGSRHPRGDSSGSATPGAAAGPG